MDLLVIGGGAAGMLCAIAAARNGANVVLIEKNEKTGKKLYITGKGRCNITNDTDFRSFLDNIVRNDKFLISALTEFDSEACKRFFEEIGLPLKTERGNRVFPVSDKSGDVIKVLNAEMKKTGVTLHMNEEVKSIAVENDQSLTVKTDVNTYRPKYLAICTGGITYPATGSTGDGYVFAGAIGHSITEPKPSLCGLRFRSVLSSDGSLLPYDKMPKLQGLSLKNVSAKAVDENDKTIKEAFGELLFTENGASGPILLTLSAFVCRRDLHCIRIILDLKPALDEKKLDERILRDFSKEKNKRFKNALDDLLPKSMIPFVIKLTGIPETKEVHSVTKEERGKLVYILKNMTFTVLDSEGVHSAVITSGGVNVKEIHPKTMQSKRCENVFFAGEVLDVDALTGGFNLQIAFATGYVAGKSIADRIKKEKEI